MESRQNGAELGRIRQNQTSWGIMEQNGAEWDIMGQNADEQEADQSGGSGAEGLVIMTFRDLMMVNVRWR